MILSAAENRKEVFEPVGISLFPYAFAESVTSLTPEILRAEGIRLLMLDFDNTIVPYTTNIPTDQMDAWLQTMLRSEITICVVSNSKSTRVPSFCREKGIDCITRAGKPFPNGIMKCLNRYAISADRAALAGDQIYTDVLGANICGVKSILVSAIHNHNILLKARHILELPAICMASFKAKRF